MTRVIHTGDTHIGYRQYHSPDRRRDFLSAFESVVDDATAEGVDAVVHAGDLFNDRRPDLQDLLGTITVLEELRAAEIPFLAIVGNHEDARRGQWLDLFEQLGLATHLDSSGTVLGDTTFYGLDYVPKSKRADLEFQFDVPETESTALVAHGLFEPFPHGDWDLEAILEASNVEFDAVLLGDNHAPETKQLGETWVTYCGSTERASAAERDPRGYNIVEFDDDVSITRRGIDTRDFVFIDVELDGSEGSEYIRERIRESSVEDAVVIVTVEGDGESITPATIEEFGRDHGALITRVNDRREFDDAAEVEVTFADPDDAVRDRIRELGLSEAAQTVDSVVRDEDIAMSNLRSRIKDRIKETLADPETFEPAESAEVAEPSAPSRGTDSSGEAAEDAEPAPVGSDEDEPDSGTASETTTVASAESGAAQPPSGSRNAPDPNTPQSAADGSDRANETEREDGTTPESSVETDDEDTEERAETEDTEEPAEPRETTMEDFL